MYDLGRLSVVALILVSIRCSGALFFEHDCGGEPYDKETEICCSNVKHVRGPHDECCGGKIIDTRVSACVLGGAFHNPRKGCHGVYYEKDEELCCDGKLTKKVPNIECCYGHLIDKRAISCKWGVRVNNDENGCNGVYYEKDEQLCCGGKLTAYDPNIECCSGDLMDKRASRCKWGMRINNDENGCDSVYYKREEQICCNKKLYPNTGYTECCSGEIMDSRASVCQWGIVVNTRKGCAGKYFDKDTEFCCADQVHHKDSTHSCCGGKTVYDPTQFTCEVAGYTLPM